MKPASATKSGYVPYLTGVGLFLAALAFYLTNLTQLAPCSFASNSGPFLGADSGEIVWKIKLFTFSGDMRKHFLFPIAASLPVEALNSLFGIEKDNAVIIVLGTIAATAITAAWWVLYRYVTTPFFALLFAVIFAIAFVNLVLFSIPETYGATQLAIVGFFWFLLSSSRDGSVRNGCFHGVAAGIAGLFNPPLLSLLVVSVLSRAQRLSLRTAAFAGTAAVVATIVFVLPYALTHGDGILSFLYKYNKKYSETSNLFDLENLLFVFISFSIVPLVSPLKKFAAMYSNDDFSSYIREAFLLTFLFVYTAVLALAVRGLFQSSNKLILPILTWFAVMFLFYSYFNPTEAPLYAGQILFPLMLLLASGLAAVSLPVWVPRGLAVIFAALLALQNIPTLYRTSSFLSSNPDVCDWNIGAGPLTHGLG